LEEEIAMIDLKKLPQLPSHKFNMEYSGRMIHKSCGEVIDFNGKLQDGWRVVGWAPNDKLPWQRDEEDLPNSCTWIGVLFENEIGELVWFHKIRDKKDIP
jgi:hypothetical protein